MGRGGDCTAVCDSILRHDGDALAADSPDVLHPPTARQAEFTNAGNRSRVADSYPLFSRYKYDLFRIHATKLRYINRPGSRIALPRDRRGHAGRGIDLVR